MPTKLDDIQEEVRKSLVKAGMPENHAGIVAYYLDATDETRARQDYPRIDWGMVLAFQAQAGNMLGEDATWMKYRVRNADWARIFRPVVDWREEMEKGFDPGVRRRRERIFTTGRIRWAAQFL